MEFEWDCRKASFNLREHGVDFADAATVLHDERALTVSDEDPDEEWLVTVGMDAMGRTLVVVYTWREDRSRPSSARKATPRERKRYGAE